jgi:hypothetical protein
MTMTPATTPAAAPPAATRPKPATTRPATRLTAEQIWHQLEGTSFAVLTHVTPHGEPRSSGVVHVATDHRLFVAVAPDSWKARQIEDGQLVSITVPVRRGGLLALVFPIPPATITFQARAIVHREHPASGSSLPTELRRLVPADRRDQAVLIEIVPEGRFVTFGIGVSLNDMRSPDRARADVPVS